ncbi:MAG TPA: exodeoxyribonuclease VII large subunit [Firmicutes bacterium]|nr:exodeoxyribonuclease VII large subunit [Bacillota bacterium]
MNQTPVTVSQLTNYIKSLLENAPPLQELCLRGEISNYKMHHSGHHYFTLKDENAVINAVMFAGNAAKLRFRPESGMKVIVYGRVSLFAKSGQYQIYVNQMVPDGVGALYIAYEQLKRRLHQEGLFNKSAKKPLPAYPERIALVTSPTGAAVRDMLRILKKRWPLSRVLVCPVKVQGEGAAQQIAEMLDYLGQHQLADLVITGRGGGSLEDLWAFNEEAVARAIYRCPIPVISAVGHEPDITISDYVADLRAATPSNAAELAVPDGEELALRLGDTFSHLAYMEKKRIDALRQRLDTLASKKIMRSPEEYLNELRLALSIQQERMIAAARQLLGAKRRRFVQQAATLDALSPLKVLGRGYGFVTREGAIVKSADDLQAGDQIQIRLQGGRADCQVQQIQKEG